MQPKSETITLQTQVMAIGGLTPEEARGMELAFGHCLSTDVARCIADDMAAALDRMLCDGVK